MHYHTDGRGVIVNGRSQNRYTGLHSTHTAPTWGTFTEQNIMDNLHPVMAKALRAFAPPPRTPQPTPEQQAALDQFKAKYGQHWKDELFHKWWSGRDVNEPGGALLRQVRNQLGPSWLAEQ